MKFWILWGVDAVIAVVVLGFFLWGLADGSVSSFNIGLWLGILAILAAVLFGSIWLRSSGKILVAVLLLLALALPGILAAFLFLLLSTTQTNWH